jgi:hypothetical protein
MATMPATSLSQDVARRLMGDGYVVVTGMMPPDSVQEARTCWCGRAGCSGATCSGRPALCVNAGFRVELVGGVAASDGRVCGQVLGKVGGGGGQPSGVQVHCVHPTTDGNKQLMGLFISGEYAPGGRFLCLREAVFPLPSASLQTA